MEHFLLYSIVSTIFTIFSLTMLEVTPDISNLEESEPLPPPNQTFEADKQAQRAPDLSGDDITPDSITRDPSTNNNENGRTTSSSNFERPLESMRAVVAGI